MKRVILNYKHFYGEGYKPRMHATDKILEETTTTDQRGDRVTWDIQRMKENSYLWQDSKGKRYARRELQARKENKRRITIRWNHSTVF